jgi:hypothetical protein
MKKVSIIALSAIGATLVACSSMNGMSSLSTISSVVSQNAPLTQTGIVAGLKEALVQGVTKGVTKLAVKNGYYNDLATRIGLPEEALVITQNIAKLPGGEKLVQNVVQRINESASDAVKEASPIFVNAIKDMSFTDAAKILAGGNTAATTYFKSKCKPDLKRLFASKIQTSLDKKLVGDVSASSSWNTLTGQWNNVANSVIGKATGLKSVNTDLTDYLTEQAVYGLFKKVGEEETAIRTKASARTSTLLKRVFGR